MNIEQPRWKTPEFTKREINDSGSTIGNINIAKEEKAQALVVVDNWRAAHAYPLHVFYSNLRQKAGSREDIIVAQRLKRLDSIEKKLQREDGMKLYRMQDLGGCRVVLPTLDEVYSFSRKYETSRIRHEQKKVNDYIVNPKASGYRSLHMVYRFHSDTAGKEIFNEYNMLIELQFRTHLQHIWATAVETFGLFTNQELKASEGADYEKRFFVLVSSLFALRERCPVVPSTIDDEKELITEIEYINSRYHILDKLRAIKTVIDHDADQIPDKRGYYILQLDYQKSNMKRIFFKPSESEIANKTYEFLESENTDNLLDIVLVRASSYGIVKTAYPNYFMDIGEFVSIVTDYLK